MSIVTNLILCALLLTLTQANQLNNVMNNVTANLSNYLNNAQLNFEVWTGFQAIDWYFPATSNTGIFFELVTKQGESLSNVSSETPIVFWFQGGPGCSSQFGSWGEMGPFYIDQNLNVQQRSTSWNKYAMMIYLDQPLNVGFSYTDTGFMVNNTITAGQHFENFVYNFIKNIGFLNRNPVYLFGESYGGHYVPYFAWLLNSNSTKNFVNLKGIGVGDGLTDSINQFQTYDAYYYSAAVADGYTRNEMLQEEIYGLQQYAINNLVGAENSFEWLTNQTAFFGNIDIYNYENYGDQPSYYATWLSNSTNAQNYGIPSFITYDDCNNPMYTAFQIDIATSYKTYVEQLLAEGFLVMLYNGQLDIIVNTPGALKWINTINWSNIYQWQRSTKGIWQINNSTVGTFKNYETFTQAVVYGAGHMVPQDQPISALDLFRRYLQWDWKWI